MHDMDRYQMTRKRLHLELLGAGGDSLLSARCLSRIRTRSTPRKLAMKDVIAIRPAFWPNEAGMQHSKHASQGERLTQILDEPENARPEWRPLYVDVVVYYEVYGVLDKEQTIGAVANLLPPGASAFGGVQELPFSLQLPAFPVSYEGSLVKIRWYVGAYARGKGDAGPSEHSIPIVIS